eukprot:CAMPEP_0179051156 /NCGR_PEP_ID=MMETSP0796-20121207/21101_1 /TAXON_ID=73915 /ORGANISM="Pyrodinium bahamense, Strain pbaha01" /LENGTH=88 /DNA_ID=CAMNT_0020747691 /DNA_START=47 /DNA_END=313 /DNA_ORIENTATION=-
MTPHTEACKVEVPVEAVLRETVASLGQEDRWRERPARLGHHGYEDRLRLKPRGTPLLRGTRTVDEVRLRKACVAVGLPHSMQMTQFFL